MSYAASRWLKPTGKILSLIAIGFTVACTSAPSSTSAQRAANSSRPTPEQGKELDLSRNGDAEDVICERKSVTGSRFPQKVCMTRAMWEDRNDAGKETVDTINRKSLQMCVVSAGGGCGG